MAALFTTNEILFEQKVTPEITEAVKALWKDPGILELYGRANEYQLIDSAAYFFENIDRIVDEDYIPTKDDLLRECSLLGGKASPLQPLTRGRRACQDHWYHRDRVQLPGSALAHGGRRWPA